MESMLYPAQPIAPQLISQTHALQTPARHKYNIQPSGINKPKVEAI